MYMGHIEEFLQKERWFIYEVMTDTELMTHYLEIMRIGQEPLYPHQSRLMMNIINRIEEYITDDMKNDLSSLSDKDLIKKYNLKPQTVSTKYVSIKVDNIKDSLLQRVDVNKVREQCQQEYDLYLERGWL